MPDVVQVAAHAQDHVIAHHQRRHGCPISFFDVADFHIPADFAVLCFERNQVCIGSGEVEPLFVHGDPTMPKVHTFVWLVCVVPDLVARTGIDSPHVVRHGEIQHAVYQQRGRLDAWSPGRFEMPTPARAIRRSAE